MRTFDEIARQIQQAVHSARCYGIEVTRIFLGHGEWLTLRGEAPLGHFIEYRHSVNSGFYFRNLRVVEVNEVSCLEVAVKIP